MTPGVSTLTIEPWTTLPLKTDSSCLPYTDYWMVLAHHHGFLNWICGRDFVKFECVNRIFLKWHFELTYDIMSIISCHLICVTPHLSFKLLWTTCFNLFSENLLLCFFYDIPMFSPTLVENLDHLKQFFTSLLSTLLFIGLLKSEWIL